MQNTHDKMKYVERRKRKIKAGWDLRKMKGKQIPCDVT